jgi:hypothetical protein
MLVRIAGVADLQVGLNDARLHCERLLYRTIFRRSFERRIGPLGVAFRYLRLISCGANIPRSLWLSLTAALTSSAKLQEDHLINVRNAARQRSSVIVTEHDSVRSEGGRPTGFL